MYTVSLQHIFKYWKINRSRQLRHGEVFYNLHIEQEKNSVIISHRQDKTLVLMSIGNYQNEMLIKSLV